MKRRGIAVLNDVLFVCAGALVLTFVMGIVYAIIVGVAPLATNSTSQAVLNNILLFLQFLDFSMFIGFVGLSGFSIWLAYMLRTNSLFMFIWIVIFAILVPMSNTLSNVYTDIFAQPAFALANANLPYARIFLARLPIWLTVVGLLGFVATFGKVETPPIQQGGFY